MPAFLQTKQYLISKQEMSYVMLCYGKFYDKKKSCFAEREFFAIKSTRKVKLE